MIGAYAGEIGQTQFLPSSYIKYGVDFDGDGRVDLRHSVADVLASTANLLHTNGFKMGAPYGEGSANFEAMREWNHAVIYRKTIAYFADQLMARFVNIRIPSQRPLFANVKIDRATSKYMFPVEFGI